MSDAKQVKAQLLNVFQKIVHKIGNDMTVKMDYIVPTVFNINPSSLEPYTNEGQKEKKYFMDFCIGKKIGEEVLPGLCIQVYGNLPMDINKVHSKLHSLKYNHPQARCGMMLYEGEGIQKDVLRPTNDLMRHIDFIEALKPILGSDKIYTTLDRLVDVQLKSSRIISDAVFGEREVRSIRKTYS